MGKGPDDAAKAIAKRFETSKSNAYRLVMTESAAIAARATEDCYTELGVEEFEVLETLDHHTCTVCGEMDGKHFPQSQYEIGVTVPPFHPRCRGTTVPYFSDMEEYGERFARDLEGNTFYVSADTTYEQWKQMQDDKYGTGSVDKARQMAYNKSADLRQYEQYKQVLGNNAPKSFNDFQNIKYDDTLYSMFKGYANSIKTGELTPLADFELYKNINNEIDSKLVGITTSNGIQITGKSKHFIARTIGSVEQRRNGVSVDNSLDVLTNDNATVFPVRENANGRSQKFRYNDVEITINPDTGILIQVNPWKKVR